jgi:hypothetical protein
MNKGWVIPNYDYDPKVGRHIYDVFVKTVELVALKFMLVVFYFIWFMAGLTIMLQFLNAAMTDFSQLW